MKKNGGQAKNGAGYHKQAQKELKLSEIKYKTLFDNMSSGVAIYQARNDGEDFVFVDFNRAAERIEKIKKEDLIGKSVLEVFPGIKDFGLFEVFQRVWKTGKPENYPVSQYKDERIVGWRENHIYKLPSGEIVAIYDDITERKKSEMALRMSEQCFHAIADYSYFWETWVSPAGRPIWTNPAVTRVAGYTPNELKAMQDYPMPLVYKDDQPKVSRAFKSAMKGGRGREFEFRLCKKDGTVIWVDMSWQPIHDEKDLSIGYRASIRDITEQKLLQNTLQQSEEKYRKLIETAADAVFVADTETGIILDVNKKAEELLGMSSNEIVGLHQTQLHPKEDIEKYRNVFRSDIKKGRSVTTKEIFVCHKDGHRIPVEINSSVTDVGGKKIIHGIFRDITDRRKADNQLRQSEERYRALVENVELGIALVDADHNIIMANSAVGKLFDCDVSGLAGKKCYNIFEKRQKVCLHCPGEKAMKTGQTHEVDSKGVRDDGSHFSIRIQAFPLFADDGQPAGFIEVIEDITERKRIERALQMIVEGSSAAVGPQFFRSLVKSLSLALGFKYAFIGELTSKQPASVQTLAVWADNDFPDNFEYNLAGTPCENVVAKEMCFHTNNAAKHFPRDVLLKEWTVESYFGVPLFDAFDKPLGLLAVMHNEPVEDVSKIEPILKIFAARASAELERIRAELKVADLAKFPAENPNPVLRISGDGTVLYSNKAAAVLLDNAQCCDADSTLKHLHKYVPKALKLSEPLQSEITCCDKAYSLTFAPVADSDYVNVYGFDITDRKQAEKKLNKERDFSNTLIQSSPIFFVAINAEGKTMMMNQVMLKALGYKKDEVVGTDYSKVFVPEHDRQRLSKIFEKLVKSHDTTLNENHVLTKDGRELLVEWRGRPVFKVNGKFDYFFGVGIDITDRKLAEQARQKLNKELVAKNKELESILYAASHDLKPPLVNIQGFSHELSKSCEVIRSALTSKGKTADMDKAMDAALNKDIPEALGFISTSTIKMDSLLSGLLDLCRLGTTATNLTHIDMDALMTDVASNMEYQIKEAKAKLDVDPLPPCVGDPSQINRAFSNLLTNALKFLDESRPGQIRVYGKSRDNNSIYCVEDNGMGIAPEHQEKIFQIFYQNEPDKRTGEGLGLTIVRRIIEKNDGQVWVESKPGKGSKFFVSLPGD